MELLIKKNYYELVLINVVPIQHALKVNKTIYFIKIFFIKL